MNNGTILADVKHWNDLIDVLSTVLNTVGVVVGDTVDLVLSFVRQIAVAAYPHLRGLSCMVPGGQFLKKLNGQPRGDNEYLAIASDYEPTDSHVASFFRDMVTDGLFSEKPNDSMVRIDSVVGTGADGEFAKVTDQFLLGETKGVQHSGYFANKDVADKLVSWLQEGLPSTSAEHGIATNLASRRPGWHCPSRLRRGGGPPTMPVLVLFTYGARPGSLR